MRPLDASRLSALLRKGSRNALLLALVLAFLQTNLFSWQNQTQIVPPQRTPAAGTLDSPVKQTSAPVPTSDTIVLPKDTPVCMLSTQRISSKTAKLNDRVAFRVAENISADNLTMIPKGTEIWGTVTEAQKAGRYPHDAKLSFAFEALPLLSGQTVPIREPQKPKESFGKEVKLFWDTSGPWLMPFAPLYFVMKGDDDVLTKSTCVWVDTTLDISLDKLQVLRLQQARPHIVPSSDIKSTSAPGPALAETARFPQPKITEITVEFGPGDIAFTPGAIWVSWGNFVNFGISRIDASTGEVVAMVLTGKHSPVQRRGQPELSPCCQAHLAVGEGAVWATNEKSISRIDPITNRTIATILLGKQTSDLAVGEGSVWVTQINSRSVSRIDPLTNKVIATVGVKGEPQSIAVGSGAIWVAHSSGISRIEPKTNTVSKTIHLRTPDWLAYIRHSVFPYQVIAQGDDVWVTASDESVVRIDARSNKVVACMRVPPRKDFFTVGPITEGRPRGAAILDGYLWVADSANETLWKIDTQTNKVIREPVLVGFHPQVFGPGNFGGGAIWVSNESDGTIMRVEP